MRIGIIEDDQILLRELAEKLKAEGYAVDTSEDGEEGLYLLEEYPLDLAIVDLGLPEMSGIEVIQNARKKGIKTPILILTARNQWQEKVEGLEAGADDYLTKPFEIPELLARMRALLRRSGRWASSTLSCGPIELDPSAQQVTFEGKPVKLTAQEYKVLHYLIQHAGVVIPKSKLHAHIYEDDQEHESNVLEVFIRRLRKKLDPKGTLKPIETLRGQGYRFTIERS